MVQHYQNTITHADLGALFRFLEDRKRVAEELGKYRESELGFDYLERCNQNIMQVLHIPLPDKDVNDKLIQSMKTELEDAVESRRRLITTNTKYRGALDRIVASLQCAKDDKICADIINIAEGALKK